MARRAPMQASLPVVEMIPSTGGAGITAFPAGAIAQAWLETHAQPLTWVELTAWLRGTPPPVH